MATTTTHSRPSASVLDQLAVTCSADVDPHALELGTDAGRLICQFCGTPYGGAPDYVPTAGLWLALAALQVTERQLADALDNFCAADSEEDRAHARYASETLTDREETIILAVERQLARLGDRQLADVENYWHRAGRPDREERLAYLATCETLHRRRLYALGLPD